MALYRYNGNERVPVSFWRESLGADAYLYCPGPSLAAAAGALRDAGLSPSGPGRVAFAVNTAYPTVRPDVWVGFDVPECYDRWVWNEPFIKITRSVRNECLCDGVPIRDRFNTYFAEDYKPRGSPFEMFSLRGHNIPFVYHRNVFVLACHIMVWMGAKRIHLVGCDMGGAADYHDDRKLSEVRRVENRLLYRQETKFLRELSGHLRGTMGVEFVSCTPGSPINEFLPYVDVVSAVRKSMEPLPKERGPIMDVRDTALAADVQWKCTDPCGDGIMLGVPPGQECLLPWWFSTYAKSGTGLPVIVADFGMAEGARWQLEKRKITVLDVSKEPARGWLRKPFALLRSPFRRTLFLDLDTEVRGDLRPLLDAANGGKIGLHQDPWINARKCSSPVHRYISTQPREVRYFDTGIIAVEHGNALIGSWAEKCKANDEHTAHGDHLPLSRLMFMLGIKPNEFSAEDVQYWYETQDGPRLVLHWCGQQGKARLFAKFAPRGASRDWGAVLACLGGRSSRIVEIGTMRYDPDGATANCDGASTLRFAEYVAKHGGSVTTVDVDPKALEKARAALSRRGLDRHVTFVCADGVDYWQAHEGGVDFLYLDGWDWTGARKAESAAKHLLALKASERHLAPGALVMFDDVLNVETWEGKGAMAIPYMLDAGRYEMVARGYQTILRRRAVQDARAADHPMRPKRVLFAFWHGLGDNIMVSPAIRQYQSDGAGVQIGWAMQRKYMNAQLFDWSPRVARVHALSSPWLIAGGGDPESFRERFMAAIQQVHQEAHYIAKTYEYDEVRFLDLHESRCNRKHRLLECAELMGVTVEDFRTEFWYDEGYAEGLITAYRPPPRGQYVFFHGNTDNPAKNLDMDVARRWCCHRAIELPIVTPRDIFRSENGNVPLFLSAHLMRHAAHRIVTDSVFYHLACAMNLKIDLAFFARRDVQDVVKPLFPVEQSVVCGREELEAEIGGVRAAASKGV